MPFFQLAQQSNSEYEEYPLIIELNFDKSSYDIIKVSENVYATKQTIYLDPEKVKIFFLSEAHVKSVLAKSKLVEETKLVFKYRENFRLIELENLAPIEFSQVIYEAYDENSLITQQYKDSIFNKLKGLIYSILIKFWELKNPIYSLTIKDDVENILKKIDILLNPYFEFAYEHLVSALKNFEKGVELQNKQTRRINLPTIIHNTSEKDIQINKTIISNPIENELLDIIVNYLVFCHDNDRPLDKNEIITMVDYLDRVIFNTPIFNNNLKKDMKILKDRVINRTYTHSFKDIDSIVMKNLLLFLLKQDKFEEIETILSENNISDAYIAYGFIGATTGFSSLSRVVTQSTVHNMELLNEIDKQVLKIKNTLWKKSNPLSKNKDISNLYEIELIPTDTEINDQDKKIELLIIERIKKIRESKILKRFTAKKIIDLKNDTSAQFEELEDDVFIYFSKKGIIQYYILLRSKNNSNMPEEQNNFKANLRRLGINNSDISRIAQGNYPVFFYFKVTENQDEALSVDDKEELLTDLELLSSR